MRKYKRLTRSMLSRGLALLRMRMICLIWPWLTLLLMQPNTTRALGWRDGLYWNANLESNRYTVKCMFLRKKYNILGKELGDGHTSEPALSTGLTTCRMGCPSYTPGGKTTPGKILPPKNLMSNEYNFPTGFFSKKMSTLLTSMISSKASVTVSREDKANVSLS